MSEARPWSNTPSCMADGMAVVLVIGEGSEGIYQLPKEIDVRCEQKLLTISAEETEWCVWVGEMKGSL